MSVGVTRGVTVSACLTAAAGASIVYRRTTMNKPERQIAALRQLHGLLSPRRRKASDRRVARLARALGHPARVRIVSELIAKQACIGCDLVGQVGLAQSTVSEHLRILKTAGIITGEI